MTLGSDSAEMVPAGGTAVNDGVVYLTSCFPENVALIGCSELSNLPVGLVVTSGLHTLPNKRLFNVPVLLKNETHADIVISLKRVLAEMYSVQQVMEAPQRDDTSQVLAESTKPHINIDFGHSLYSVRLCIAYRKLNVQTIKDAYALPNLEEAFSVLTSFKWFSVLDLKSG